MKVKEARAEDTIHAALSQADLTRGYTRQIGFEFTEAEVANFGVYGTTVDGMWKEVRLIVFYDGPPHLKAHQKTKDEAIQACLEARGYRVERYPYRAPISKARVTEIVLNIGQVLKLCAVKG